MVTCYKVQTVEAGHRPPYGWPFAFSLVNAVSMPQDRPVFFPVNPCSDAFSFVWNTSCVADAGRERVKSGSADTFRRAKSLSLPEMFTPPFVNENITCLVKLAEVAP